MNIGVFGDSFAGGNHPDSWTARLTKLGHQVLSLGKDGSSIWYSTKCLLQNHHRFDFLILCLTSTQRWSWQQRDGGWMHTANPLVYDQTKLDHEDRVKLQVCRDYMKYISDADENCFLAQSLVQKLLHDIPNLMIIPCFSNPLSQDFYLFGITEREMHPALAQGLNFDQINAKYRDTRVCHMTWKNHQNLAELVNQNLSHGIFQTDYTNFDFTTTCDEWLIKK